MEYPSYVQRSRKKLEVVVRTAERNRSRYTSLYAFWLAHEGKIVSYPSILSGKYYADYKERIVKLCDRKIPYTKVQQNQELLNSILDEFIRENKPGSCALLAELAGLSRSGFYKSCYRSIQRRAREYFFSQGKRSLDKQ